MVVIYGLLKFTPKRSLQYPLNKPIFEYQNFNSLKSAGTKENLV